MSRLAASLAAIVATLQLISLAGCATPTLSSGMTVVTGQGPTPLIGSIGDHAMRVEQISGGGGTSAIGLSDISNDEFRQALTMSLRNLGYLSADGSAASLRLTADLVDLDRPVAALDPALLLVPIDLSVTVKVHYRVTPSAGGHPVFDAIVATTGTASARDSILPAGRVRKANEAAVRLNIIEFLQRFETLTKIR